MGFDPFVLRRDLLAEIRSFFSSRGYLEVETPYIMDYCPTDPYIDPIEISLEGRTLFLHTSPEISMKKLIASGYRKIFQICRVFRLDIPDELHSLEFTMIEWYSEGTFIDGMREVEELVISIMRMLEKGFNIKKDYSYPIPVLDLETIFEKSLGVNPYSLGLDDLRSDLQKKGILNLKPEDSWLDVFLKAYVQKIEPELKKDGPKMVTGWPRDLTGMARACGLKAERFELIIGGIEVANGYTELLDPEEQRERMMRENSVRKSLNKKEFPLDNQFLASLGRIKGPIYGVALGFERLIMALMDLPSIDCLQPLRIKDLRA